MSMKRKDKFRKSYYEFRRLPERVEDKFPQSKEFFYSCMHMQQRRR